MLTGLCTLFLGCACHGQETPSSEVLQKRQAVFYHLMPDATPQQIEAAIGKPDSRRDGKPAYRMRHGAVTVEADGHRLKEVEHVDPGDGSMGDVLFYRSGPRPSAELIDRREKAIRVGLGAKLSDWSGSFVRCSGVEGEAYDLRDGYASVERICPLMGATGAFADRAARVVVHRHGKAQVVYRAWDEWDKLRPRTATDAMIAQRVAAARRPAGPQTGEQRAKALGQADGHMGSGVDYGLYWLPDGLLVVCLTGGIDRAHLSQPGADRQVGLKEWLGGKRPARKR